MEFSDVDLKLSGQRALLGNVPGSLRAVSVEFAGNQIEFQAVFDGTPSPEDKELLSECATEILADFPAPFTINEVYLSISAPAKIPHLKNLIYSRYEI